jgi:hypothetical protein
LHLWLSGPPPLSFAVSPIMFRKLLGIVIGVKQNIAQNIERMMRGERLDETNTISSG